eukprot:907764-Rhodomonas_salina.1
MDGGWNQSGMKKKQTHRRTDRDQATEQHAPLTHSRPNRPPPHVGAPIRLPLPLPSCQSWLEDS